MSENLIPNEERLLKTILGPLITEKTTHITEQGNYYAFKVAINATKTEIKRAVEHLFNVNVRAVKVLNQKGKAKRFGQIIGKRNDIRKAYVRLNEGQTIDLAGKE